MASLEVLRGHVSPETAYVVDDYPYGFRLRCKIRYWVESNGKKGSRVASQTTNPKVPGREVWNRPKYSTYSDLVFLYLDDAGHVRHATVHALSEGPRGFSAIKARFGAAFGPDETRRIQAFERFSRKLNPNSWAEWDASNPGSTFVTPEPVASPVVVAS